MTFIWLIVWLLKGHPAFHFGYSSWAIFLGVAIILDAFEIISKVN